jgi:glycyl-tRNA synthetase
LEGVAYRTDYDLQQHIKSSGKTLDYFDEETKERFVPHVVEPSAGVDRTVLALICDAYDEDSAPDEKGKNGDADCDALSSADGADQMRGLSVA